jgi:hypothetical protein
MTASLPFHILTLGSTIIVLLFGNEPAQAQRLSWKPHDFKPLTELPWLDVKPHEVPKVIERIFREPNNDIRLSVLTSYLKDEVPLIHFGLAFDLAIALEGVQRPNHLVSMMLEIWARRDPEAAFERVKQLFDLVGIENGWLNYDSWHHRDTITVQNLEAIRKSRFWIDRDTIASFPYDADLSDFDSARKRSLLKAFMDQWFDHFEDWPQENKRTQDLPELFQVLDSGTLPPEPAEGPAAEMFFEISMRKGLAFAPNSAAKLMRQIKSKRWQADDERRLPEQAATVSREFLLLWSQLDFDGMRRWVEIQPKEEVWTAKCILIHRVDEKTRRNWLREIPEKELGDALNELAGWQPEMAMEKALRSMDAEIISQAFDGCAYGASAMNGVHAGFGYLYQFDLSRLPKDCIDQVLGENAIYVMEQWGGIDAGECARFGIRCLKHSPWVEWPEMCRFFSGHDTMSDEGGVTDRTFCSLRIWAVTRPDEMKAWIATEPDAELRKALTWLLEHPWGHHPKP